MSAAGSDPEDDMPRMPLAAHLDELRARLLRSLVAVVVAMIVAFVMHEQVLAFVMEPYVKAATQQGLVNPTLQTIAPGEGFLQALKVAFLAGVLLSGPWVLWQLWGFVSAGLHANERRVVLAFFPVSVLLFALGLLAAYILLIPFGLNFLIGFDQKLAGITPEYRVSDYLSLCLTAVFAMGFVFQLPLVMLMLQATGIVERKTLIRGWKIAVLVSFILGMVLTDPSPVTQIVMAMPVVGLYFLGIWAGRFVGEHAEVFRWYKAWPLVLGIAVFTAMLVFSEQLNDWAAQIFGGAKAPPAQESPPE